eukprot:4517622-Alexandrium_andersonii.AAC.1
MRFRKAWSTSAAVVKMRGLKRDWGLPVARVDALARQATGHLQARQLWAAPFGQGARSSQRLLNGLG